MIWAKSGYDALEGADALAVVTEWLVYRTPDFDRIKAALRQVPPGHAGAPNLAKLAYFSPSWTAFQADRGRDFSVIVDGVSV